HSCIPSQADSLNDRSSTPPVSVTIEIVNCSSSPPSSGAAPLSVPSSVPPPLPQAAKSKADVPNIANFFQFAIYKLLHFLHRIFLCKFYLLPYSCPSYHCCI